ncbi:ABC transporter ATP-binding protein [Bernardetia sp.]|uniref:ABC transporter ATP-binding protein n=1 Tax=Bernardetia sp. TaxID=1937974 RepID=UPI0025BD411C|nr:ABC transporter ATP-binding protein [Bernardetia sp.]
MLIAKNIVKKYGSLEVLQGIDVSIAKKEVVAITGSSGAGKSTLLHILGTLDSPDKGEIIINGVEVQKLKSNKLAHFRNEQIGFIFQFHNLLPEFSALENVCMPAFIGKKSVKDAEKRAIELLERFGIADRKDHKPSELSGGEQQRVAVARALINSPALVFADEPSGNLDSKNAEELHNLFFTLREEFSQTFVIVTHNPELAKMADREIVLKKGLVVA